MNNSSIFFLSYSIKFRSCLDQTRFIYCHFQQNKISKLKIRLFDLKMYLMFQLMQLQVHRCNLDEFTLLQMAYGFIMRLQMNKLWEILIQQRCKCLDIFSQVSEVFHRTITNETVHMIIMFTVWCAAIQKAHGCNCISFELNLLVG